MTPKDPFLEGTFWDISWRPIRSQALLFTPENNFSGICALKCVSASMVHDACKVLRGESRQEIRRIATSMNF